MYEFKKDDEGNIPLSDIGTDVISLIVRLFGFSLLLAGLWVAISVMLHALELYDDPQKIEQLAVYIERGSNIDSSLVAVREEAGAKTGNGVKQTASNNIRVSYFFAWMIALLLLLLVGRISLTAVKTGGELVLYDVQIKRFARELAKESFKGPK